MAPKPTTATVIVDGELDRSVMCVTPSLRGELAHTRYEVANDVFY